MSILGILRISEKTYFGSKKSSFGRIDTPNDSNDQKYTQVSKMAKKMKIAWKLDFLEPIYDFSEILKMLKMLKMCHFGKIWAVLRSGCPKNQEISKI